MKKIFLVLCAIVSIGIGCSKVETTVKPEIKTDKSDRSVNDKITFNGHNYNIANGMLEFSSFSEYEELFNVSKPSDLDIFTNTVENSDAMITYSKQLTLAEKQNLYLIRSLVNEQGMIKIDVFTLLLNFKHKVIYATRYGTTNDLMSAKNGNIPTNVFQLNMEGEETIDALLAIKTRGVLCKESYADKQQKSGSILTNVNEISLTASVKYWQYGIVYTLTTFDKTNVSGTYSGPTPNYNCVTTGWWQRRCSSVSGTINENLNFATGAGAINSGSSFYSNVRALKHYNVTRTLTSTNSVPSCYLKTININDL